MPKYRFICFFFPPKFHAIYDLPARIFHSIKTMARKSEMDTYIHTFPWTHTYTILLYLPTPDIYSS